MTSNRQAYVWIWLPETEDPVVAGKIVSEEGNLIFNYGKSYLERKDAIPIYDVELPLKQGALPLLSGLMMPGCIRDAAPDAWGRRVILHRKLGIVGKNVDVGQLDELTYLLESGSDRVGTLDFQLSPENYKPRCCQNVALEELQESALCIEKGMPLSPELDRAIHHGTSIGGARPKAQIEDGKKKYIAKFSSTTDLYGVVKAEFLAMRLAKHVGLNVANVRLEEASHKDVLLVERFDRILTSKGWQRKIMLSALTMLGLNEMMARYASYEDLAEIVRHRFSDPKHTLKELFGRIVYNILCGNTDDHARNHAAFFDGKMLTLTPAYDICPQGRSGNEASQAMLIVGNNRMSQIKSCVDAAKNFLLSKKEALVLAEEQVRSIVEKWDIVCEEAGLSQADRKLLWKRQFLNPYAFEGLTEARNWQTA